MDWSRSLMRAIERNSDRPFVIGLGRFATAVARASSNPGYRFELNGERRIIEMMCHDAADPIFDVGAHRGAWSAAARAVAPKRVMVYAFEPAREPFRLLSTRFAGVPGIELHPIGLSDEPGPRTLLYSAASPQKASVEFASRRLHTHLHYLPEESVFTTGDRFCEDHGIERIALLKIDTEGHDLKVLQGFRKMIEGSAVAAIQFEYNRLNIFTKHLLVDFYDLLDAYRIGRIFPRSVRFKDYNPLDENFIDGNFLAVLDRSLERDVQSMSST